MRNPMVERGSIIEDWQGDVWQVLEVTDEGIFMRRIKPKVSKGSLHTRSIKWDQLGEGKHYWLAFP
jgi:hypothetical protein